MYNIDTFIMWKLQSVPLESMLGGLTVITLLTVCLTKNGYCTVLEKTWVNLPVLSGAGESLASWGKWCEGGSLSNWGLARCWTSQEIKKHCFYCTKPGGWNNFFSQLFLDEISIKSVTIQMKAAEQYFPVVLFIMPYKVVLTFESGMKS